jgi:hypothetical protein
MWKSGNQERETDEEVFTTKERQRGIQGGAKGSQITGMGSNAQS